MIEPIITECWYTLSHLDHVLSLPDLCSAVKINDFPKNLYFHQMTDMVTFKHKNPCLKSHEIYNMVDPRVL